MRLTVNEVSRKCGVSIRALHYYDEMGLLKPCGVTDAGYRLYSERELKRLQQILFLRELELPIKEIPSLLDSAENGQADMLKKHLTLLIMKRDRLNGIIALCQKLIKGEDTMDFTPFDQSKIDEKKQEYAKEAKERWGNTQAYQQSEQNKSKRTKEDNEAMLTEQDEIFAAFAAHVGEDADSAAVLALAKRWQEHITKWHYPCSKQILATLGEMYVGDERFQQNLDAHGKGTAKLMSEAIAAYCKD